ncbi:hypothetical protein PInf_007879 [Phytophthora infestans]|nr:hypothetical protein PInf_007879 [Phytophthora infestans]
MEHRRAFWEWFFHVPLESTTALSHRRKIKLKAFNARLSLFSLCVETMGFFDFLEELDKHLQLFGLGGPPGWSSSDTRKAGHPQNALDLDKIDSYGYRTVRAFLEQTEPILPQTQPHLRLSNTALARTRSGLTSSPQQKLLNAAASGATSLLRVAGKTGMCVSGPGASTAAMPLNSSEV